MNNRHLTDKVIKMEFIAKINGVLATIKILIMKSFSMWKIDIETSLRKIQRIPYMVAGPHWYNYFFARVQITKQNHNVTFTKRNYSLCFVQTKNLLIALE